MALAINPSRTDKQERQQRAAEWKKFRRDYLYSQDNLATELGCSRRTITGIESGNEVIRPRASLLRRFNALKVKCEKQIRAIERRGQVA